MTEQPAATVPKSVDNFDLVHKRRAEGVWAYEIAAELHIHPTAVSHFETGRRPTMPAGMGRSEYVEALERIVRRREQEAGAA